MGSLPNIDFGVFWASQGSEVSKVSGFEDGLLTWAANLDFL